MYAYHCSQVFFWIKLQFYNILSNPQFFNTYVRWKSSDLSENVSCSFFNCILIVFVCLSLHLWFFKKIFYSIYSFKVSSISTEMWCKNLQFIRKCLHFFFKLHYNYFCLCTIVSVKIPQNLQFLNFSYVFPLLYVICYTKPSIFFRKCLHFLFQLYSNCICMLKIVSEVFLRKFSVLSVILCNPKFYHT